MPACPSSLQSVTSFEGAIHVGWRCARDPSGWMGGGDLTSVYPSGHLEYMGILYFDRLF